jgi:uncharacterized protein (DUF433 family)
MTKPHIISDPEIMVGQPIIEGTRITVSLILNELAHGNSVNDIIRNFPHLTRESIKAAIEFARESVEDIRAYPAISKVG